MIAALFSAIKKGRCFMDDNNSSTRDIDKAIHVLLQDPLTVREVEKMRQQGRSETYVHNWLMQIAKLQP